MGNGWADKSGTNRFLWNCCHRHAGVVGNGQAVRLANSLQWSYCPGHARGKNKGETDWSAIRKTVHHKLSASWKNYNADKLGTAPAAISHNQLFERIRHNKNMQWWTSPLKKQNMALTLKNTGTFFNCNNIGKTEEKRAAANVVFPRHLAVPWDRHIPDFTGKTLPCTQRNKKVPVQCTFKSSVLCYLTVPCFVLSLWAKSTQSIPPRWHFWALTA